MSMGGEYFVYMYMGALVTGLRFPFQEFIPRLLTDFQVNPFQPPPNAWRNILYFMVLFLGIKFPLSLVLLKKIFQFYNSPLSQSGRILIRLRPKIPFILDGLTIPENNLKWRDEFVRLI